MIDAKDLVRVLRACRQAGVTELKIGELQVKFGSGDTPEWKAEGLAKPKVTQAELEEAKKDAVTIENLATAEDRLALLQIDDPALYEQLILERELEDRGKPAEITEH